MKKFIVIGTVLISGAAFAADPSTTCPSGYTTITESNVVLANTTCPSGYTSIGTVTSCLLASPSGSCYMFAPANTTYSNAKGSYRYYNEMCPLT